MLSEVLKLCTIDEAGRFEQNSQTKSREKRMMRVNVHGLIDNAKCHPMVRRLRWPEGIECPHCHTAEITKNGRDETQTDRQKYLCRMCHRAFDDLTGTVFAGHHQPLSEWMLCLYFVGLNP